MRAAIQSQGADDRKFTARENAAASIERTSLDMAGYIT
jgi:hypothetical protein